MSVFLTHNECGSHSRDKLKKTTDKTFQVLFFYLALVAQLIRLGAITGKELIVDSTLLETWNTADSGAAWQKYDAAYFERRFFWVIFNILGTHTAVDYNLRRTGKRKLVDPFFLRQWRHLVIRLRTDIERHFAWIKRYFSLKYIQCFTCLRVSQFVLLTHIVALAIALTAQRGDRPELVRCHSMVLAYV